MKLENQVTNLELSKKLKELGFKQESLFYWGKTLGKFEIIYFPGNLTKSDAEIGRVSAFTVAELGEMLPEFVMSMRRTDDYLCTDFMNYRPYDYGKHEAETEADARAKMLIYLIENDLIKK